MSKKFAIGDIHGRFDLLQEAIRQIELTSHTGGTVVFVGDYVDRGLQSREVIEFLMAGPSDPARWEWICLQGNHEDMLLTCVKDEYRAAQWWIPNGGDATLFSYGAQENELLEDAMRRIPQEHLAWMKALPLMAKDDHRVFVHAMLDETVQLEDQTAQTMQWSRYPKNYEGGYGDLHVVHGHTPHKKPELMSGRTNLDTHAVYSGVLSVGVFEDDRPGGPRSIMSITLADSSPIFSAA